MKPILLQISGLNSFRQKQTIEFESLTQDRIFGIFGPTGSGKTSILDAITLALYGRVRRASGGTHGIINVRETACTVSFTFEIGPPENRCRYTVERKLVRTKSGGIEAKRQRLLEHRDNDLIPIAEKKNELRDKVSEIVGINAEDFLRAVVLPQGAFAEFLSLEPRERGAMLQRLFRLQDLGERLAARLKHYETQLETERSATEGRILELRPYDHQACIAAELTLSTAEERLMIARSTAVNCNEEHNSAVRLRTALEALDALTIDAPERDTNLARLQQLQTQIDRAERSRTVKPSLDIWKSTHTRLTEVKAQYEDAVSAYNKAEEQRAHAQAEFELVSRDYHTRYDILCSTVTELSQLQRERETLEDRQQQLQLLHNNLAAIIEEVEDKRLRRLSIEGSVQDIVRDLAQLETEYTHQALSLHERERLASLRNALLRLKEIAEQMQDCKKEIDVLLNDLEVLEHQLQSAQRDETKKNAELERATRNVANLQQQIETHDSEYELVRRERDALHEPVLSLQALDSDLQLMEIEQQGLCVKRDGYAKTLTHITTQLQEALAFERIAIEEHRKIGLLRDQVWKRLSLSSLVADLREGEICPLCGSLDHPQPHQRGDGSRELEAVEQELHRADMASREAHQKTQDLKENRRAAEAGLESVENSIELLQIEVKGKQRRREEILSSITAKTAIGSTEDLRIYVEQLKVREEAMRQEHEQMRTRLASFESLLKDLDVDLQQQKLCSATIHAHLTAKREGHGQLHRRYTRISDLYDTQYTLYQTLSEGRAPDEIEEVIAEAVQRDQRAEGLRSKVAEIRTLHDQRRDSLDCIDLELREEHIRQATLEGTCRAVEEEIETTVADIQRRLNDLIPRSQRRNPLEQLIAERIDVRNKLQHHFEESERCFSESQLLVRETETHLSYCRTMVSRDAKAHQEANSAYLAMLRSYNFNSSHEVEEGMLSDVELARQRQEANTLQHSLNEAARRERELVETIAGQSISSEHLASLASRAASVQADHDEAIRLLGAAEQALTICRRKNGELETLLAKDTDGAAVRARVEQLGKYLRGNGFIDYLANERLSAICQAASSQLDMLTAGRLELAVRPREGFYIRDNGNGGAERPAGSLSGGETFIVSLALALALSDSIQLGRAPLELFFLDEGFGSLDNDLLETVLDSLDRLRMGHRTIGVISHVPALYERISRRIMVAPADEFTGSTTRNEIA